MSVDSDKERIETNTSSSSHEMKTRIACLDARLNSAEINIKRIDRFIYSIIPIIIAVISLAGIFQLNREFKNLDEYKKNTTEKIESVIGKLGLPHITAYADKFRQPISNSIINSQIVLQKLLISEVDKESYFKGILYAEFNIILHNDGTEKTSEMNCKCFSNRPFSLSNDCSENLQYSNEDIFELVNGKDIHKDMSRNVTIKYKIDDKIDVGSIKDKHKTTIRVYYGGDKYTEETFFLHIDKKQLEAKFKEKLKFESSTPPTKQ